MRVGHGVAEQGRGDVTVFIESLERADACEEEVERFRKLFPDGAEVSEQNLRRARRLLSKNAEWVAEHAHEIGLAVRPIDDAYWAQRKPIDDACRAQRVDLLCRLILENQ